MAEMGVKNSVHQIKLWSLIFYSDVSSVVYVKNLCILKSLVFFLLSERTFK